MPEKNSNNVPEDQSSAEQKRLIDLKLSHPDLRPMDFDGTLEAWLIRVAIWGKIKITHKNPEDEINKSMSQNHFLSYIDNQHRNASYGLFNIDTPKINQITFSRKFWSIDGKEVTEEIIVDVDLKPSLKESLKRAKRKNSFLGKLGFFK